MAGKVSVRVQANGVVVHRHEGANGFHDPSRKHYGAADAVSGHKELGHTTAELLKAEGFNTLTDAQKDQYRKALAGQTFWIYPEKKATAPAGLTLEDEQALIAEMDAGFPQPETPEEFEARMLQLMDAQA